MDKERLHCSYFLYFFFGCDYFIASGITFRSSSTHGIQVLLGIFLSPFPGVCIVFNSI